MNYNRKYNREYYESLQSGNAGEFTGKKPEKIKKRKLKPYAKKIRRRNADRMYFLLDKFYSSKKDSELFDSDTIKRFKRNSKLKQFLKNLYIWALISMFLQISIMLYLDKVYWNKENKNAQFKVIDVPEEEEIKDESIKIDLESGFKNVSVSPDARYVSYMLNDKIKIYSVEKKEIVKVIEDSKYIINGYKWFSDRNTILYSEKEKSFGEEKPVRLISYECDSDLQLIYGEQESAHPGLWTDKMYFWDGMEIVDIIEDTAKSITYIRVSDASKNYYLYSISCQNDMELIQYFNPVKMYPLNLSTKLIGQTEDYQIQIWDKIYGISYPEQFNGKKMYLLGVTLKDLVYALELDEFDNVKKIFSGEGIKNLISTEWLSMDPPKQDINIKNVHLLENEGIYYLDNGYLCGINTQEKIKLKGEFVDVKNGYVVTISDNTLQMNKEHFEKNGQYQ